MTLPRKSATKQGEPAQRSEPHQRKDDPREGQARGGESRE